MSGVERLRVGSVPYLNARPLVYGLEAEPCVEYREDVPSRLAAELADGRLDVALVSSIESLRPGRTSVDGACIASDGPVLSVKVVSRGDPRSARTVALDGASLTAAALTRIVYREFLGRDDVTFVPAAVCPDPQRSGADATLLIGDAALALPDDGATQLDLGAAWSEATGLPFVWALWVLRPGARDACGEGAAAPLLRALERGLGKRAELARDGAARAGVEVPRARRYLEEVMRYRLDTRGCEGLAKFAELARRSGLA